MQCVILAAGRGTRMGDLTKETPKSMLVVAGRTLLQHKLDALPEEVDEVIIVVGHLQEVIRAAIGSSYKGKKITYVTQENPVGGSMDALAHAQPLLHGRFFVMNGDNIYSRADMRKCIEHEWAVVVEETRELGNAASVSVDENGRVTDIVEASYHKGGAGYANLNLFLFDMRVFDQTPVPKGPGATELGLPQTAVAASHAFGISFHVVKTEFWLQTKTPEDLVAAERFLGKK